jgi:hypothetical protein
MADERIPALQRAIEPPNGGAPIGGYARLNWG